MAPDGPELRRYDLAPSARTSGAPGVELPVLAATVSAVPALDPRAAPK
jgi:hypothetical protein